MWSREKELESAEAIAKTLAYRKRSAAEGRPVTRKIKGLIGEVKRKTFDKKKNI